MRKKKKRAAPRESFHLTEPWLLRGVSDLQGPLRSSASATKIFAEAATAVESCDGIELDGRELRVRVDKGQKFARPREARAARRPPAGKTVDPTKVFVTNLGHVQPARALLVRRRGCLGGATHARI